MLSNNSPRAKLLISFKASKEDEENNDMIDILEEISVTKLERLSLKVKISQEACSAALYLKNSFLNNSRKNISKSK